MQIKKNIFWYAWGGVCIVSTTAPQDIQSNISAWLQVVGIENLPSWVVSKNIDHSVYIFLAVSASIMMWVYIKDFFEKRKQNAILYELKARIINLLNEAKSIKDDEINYWKLKVDQIIRDVYGSNSALYKIFSKQIDDSGVDASFNNWKDIRRASRKYGYGKIHSDGHINSNPLDWELFWLEKIR